jgi:formylglycine-generating enzyme required for sulfatase activity
MKQENTQGKAMVVVPDDFSAVDQIGYSEHSAGLVEMIRCVQAKGSFTIGIFGQWGQGKTSMLRQIEKNLQGTKSNHGKDILTVWFNPWQFTGEKHMIIPFFHTVTSYLKDFEKQKKKEGKTIGKKIRNFLKVLGHVPVALAYGMEGGIKIPRLLEAEFNLKLKDAIDELREKKKKVDQTSMSKLKKLVNKYESMYYRLISTLQDAANELELKIVVFIDDLDRCLPEKAVELLEGIKVLLDLPGFVFVIGAAPRVIEQGIRVRYRELYANDKARAPFLEQEYLDKIIQFPLTLPPPDSGRIKSMLANYLENLGEVKPYLETIQKALGSNPRSLKRFINSLSYTFWVAGKQEEKRGGTFRPELLIKITLIAFKFPGFYRVIGKTPDHLLRVQDLIGKEIQKIKEKKSGKMTQTAYGILEIDKLNLFQPPYIESITEILGKYERKGAEADKGFVNEKEVRRYVSLLPAAATAAGEPGKTGTSLRKTMDSRMMEIAGGKLLMKDEESGHEFTTGIKPFRLDKFPVTQDLYEKIMGKEKNRSRFPGGDRPVEHVSWFEAVEFCNLLSDEMGLKTVYTINGENLEADFEAAGFRLPSEAEWEYACRAGTTGDRYGKIEEIAWYLDNSDGTTHGVGKMHPNKWEIYDMLGNVWEWCWDRYGNYPNQDTKELPGAKQGDDRVFRGGSWNSNPGKCRASLRVYGRPSFHDHDLGFRLARSM